MGDTSMTGRDLRDMTADQVNELLDNLAPVSTTPGEQAALVAALPVAGDPDAPMSVVRSLRLPEDLNRRLDKAAAAGGIPVSTFIRRAIESALAGRVKENLVSLDDVIRAIRTVPPAAA